MSTATRIDPLTAVRLAALRVKLRQQVAAKSVSEFPMSPWTKYIGVTPTPTQIEFLKLQNLEALYGGAGGGGKTYALLMAALQYVDQPGYAALLLRRTFTDLSKPKALLDIAFQWLSNTDAVWKDKENTWHFPSGATLTFGYMDSERDKYQYQGGSWSFVGWDETTQFYETQYKFLFGWLRGLESRKFPLRVRAASNPGGIGHDWVKQRFFTEGETEGRIFIPAKLQDNPYLAQEEYIKSLSNLDPITRAQILNGDWTARQGGSMFKREWFQVVDTAPVELRKIRYWDMAATEPKPGKDPDFTVGALKGVTRDGLFYILDIRRDRGTPGNIERLIKQTAEMDGKQIAIRMEEEPGSAGIGQIASYRKLLVGWNFGGVRSTGDKQTRAAPLASQAEGGNIKLIRAPWLSAFLDEVEQFPSGAHDDQVDALSGAFNYLVSQNPPGLRFL